MEIPEKLKEYLGSYGPQLYDGNSDEIVGWGYKIIKHVGEQLWPVLSRYGEKYCVYPNWYLITRRLTRAEAIKKYGKITDEEFGPRGGWRSVTFGNKTFSSKSLREG